MPRATMSGRSIVRGETAKPPYWRFNRRWRQLYLSSYHVSRDTAHSYVQAIRKYGSHWVTGYSSTIAALAECALEKELSPVPLKAAVVSGDTLLRCHSSSHEHLFQRRCLDAYG